MEFGSPNFFRKGTGLGGFPDKVLLPEGGDVFAGMDGDAAVAIGETPEVAVVVGIANDPRVGAYADWVDEVLVGRGSNFGVVGMTSVDGHLGVPIAEGFVEAGDDFGMFVGEVGGFDGIVGKVVELRSGTVVVDQVFPFAVSDGEVGIVFVEAVTKAGAIGRTSPEDGCLAGGGGLSEQGFTDIFAVELFGGLGVGDFVERTIEVDGGED